MVERTPYTPILKWKKAEEGAIKDLTDTQKDGLLPMFEFICPTKLSKAAQKQGINTIDGELTEYQSITIPQNILLSWGDGRPFLVDFTLLEPVAIRKEFVSKFIANSHKLFLQPIPVINAGEYNSDYAASAIAQSIKHLESKICLRFNKAELDNINKNLKALCQKYSLFPGTISVLIDLKEDTDEELFKRAVFALSKIDLIEEYEHIIIASGAFPKDMGGITTENDRRPRADWANWFNIQGDDEILRYPAFADYTIRHPVYDVLAELHIPTATIKYTLDAEWRFFKGRVGEYRQCLAYASAFRQDNEFYGRNFSSGDKYIDDRGLYFDEYIRNPQKGGTGNAKTWIRAGINHHIAVVVDQIANLPD